MDYTIKVYSSNIVIFYNGDREIIEWDNVCPDPELDDEYTTAKDYIDMLVDLYDGFLPRNIYREALNKWALHFADVLYSFNA